MLLGLSSTYFLPGLAALAVTGCRAESMGDLTRPIVETPPQTLGGVMKSTDVRCAPSPMTSAPIPPAIFGHVVFRLPDGHDYRVEARDGAKPEDLTKALDAIGAGTDGFVNTSPNGAWMVVQTSRFGCGADLCVAVVDRAACQAQVVVANHAPDGLTRLTSEIVRPQAISTISSKGDILIYPAEGVHPRDLFSVHRTGDAWGTPVNLTATSPLPYNLQPTISADGARVLFDCGTDPGAGAGTSICEVGTDGKGLRIAVPSEASGKKGANHHAAYAPDGSIVFEGTWNGGAEQVWRVTPDGQAALVNQEVTNDGDSRYTDDNSPCVLPDGRVASLWLGRAGSGTGQKPSGHELKLMNADGTNTQMLVTGVDVVDIGIGCSQ
jgi:hypothetical protein